MRVVKTVVSLLVCGLVLEGCGYVVLPPEASAEASTASRGWAAIATGIGPSEQSSVRIDVTIRNDSGDWSSMEAATDRPAVLTAGDGATTDCDIVRVGTGGHRLAPGFQMRGYVGGTKAEPVSELIRVECPVAEVTPGSRLAIDYTYATGEYNYYDPDANTVASRLEVDLDAVTSDPTYPIGEPIDGLVQPADLTITAINGVELTLIGRERTDSGLEFTWQTNNAGEYPSSVHIGNPPVIGNDGILYGLYQSPDIASVPITPPAERASWTTEVDVPADVGGLYIPLPVESKKQRLFVYYVLDITDS